MQAIDLGIGDRIVIRSGLRLETRTVDIVGYRKSTVELSFTDGTVRVMGNKEEVTRK